MEYFSTYRYPIDYNDCAVLSVVYLSHKQSTYLSKTFFFLLGTKFLLMRHFQNCFKTCFELDRTVSQSWMSWLKVRNSWIILYYEFCRAMISENGFVVGRALIAKYWSDLVGIERSYQWLQWTQDTLLQS